MHGPMIARTTYGAGDKGAPGRIVDGGSCCTRRAGPAGPERVLPGPSKERAGLILNKRRALYPTVAESFVWRGSRHVTKSQPAARLTIGEIHTTSGPLRAVVAVGSQDLAIAAATLDLLCAAGCFDEVGA